MSDMINSFSGEYRFLSNFYTAPIVWKGKIYPTNEHFYQAHKTDSELQHEVIRMADTAVSAKRIGQKVSLIKDWEKEKHNIMLLALYLKFTQHADLREKLFATGDVHLEEGNTWGDKVWGTVNGMGFNYLGKYLMRTRDVLRAEEGVKKMEFDNGFNNA